MINIVTVKWGTKYSASYLNKLYSGIKRNTTLPFTLHCFTDDPTGIRPEITIHPLPANNLEGWWNKLYLFSAEFPLSGRVTYMDLDTVIVGNIDDILSQDKGFIVLRNFYTGIWPTTQGDHNVGSGIMSFNAHDHHYIWEEFIKDAENISVKLDSGDQAWIQLQQQDRLYWQDVLPEQLVSFKVHCQRGIPNNARIVCYHGKPSIPESFIKTTMVHECLRGTIGDIQPAPWMQMYWID